MYSMTGYGMGSAQCDGRSITIELKSVNHRFLDISMRLPRHLSFLEDLIRKEIGGAISRGHVDVFINYVNNREDSKKVVVDLPLLTAYLQAGRQAADALALTDDLTLTAALRLPDVTEIREAEEDRAAVAALCSEAVNAALQDLKRMRAAEGEHLKTDLALHNDAIEQLTNRIAERAPFVIDEYRTKLNARVEQLLQSQEIDRARLATEVAIFADRAAVDEEIARLYSHVKKLRLLLSDGEPVGKKLDFVVQEMNREFNTIGSKANDAALTDCVLVGKNEVEKLREQVQNVE